MNVEEIVNELLKKFLKDIDRHIIKQEGKEYIRVRSGDDVYNDLEMMKEVMFEQMHNPVDGYTLFYLCKECYDNYRYFKKYYFGKWL